MELTNFATTTDYDIAVEIFNLNTWLFFTLLVMCLSVYIAKKIADNF